MAKRIDINRPVLNLKSHGDLLEREFYDLIKSSLPAYELIWTMYIGNDGYNKIPQVHGLPLNEKMRRIEFSVYHYTILESLVCMKVIVDKADTIDVNSIRSLKDYIEQQNAFICFHAHCGRIHDNLSKLIDSIGQLNNQVDGISLPSLDSLKAFWDNRNTVLHGTKLPYKLDKDILQLQIPLEVPLREKLNNGPKVSYDEKKNWDQEINVIVNFLSDYLKETFEGMIYQVNGVLNGVIPFVKSIVGKYKIKLQGPTNTLPSIHTLPYTSGSLNTNS